MDLKSKKFWLTVLIEIVCIYGMVTHQVDFMEGLQWMMGIGAAWMGADVVDKKLSPKEK